MVQNGPKWSKMVQNGEKWSKWSKWSKWWNMVKMVKTGQNGQKLSKWSKMVPNTVFKFISKHLIINWLSTRNHPDNWLPWINPTRTTDRAGLQKPSSKRRDRK